MKRPGRRGRLNHHSSTSLSRHEEVHVRQEVQLFFLLSWISRLMSLPALRLRSDQGFANQRKINTCTGIGLNGKIEQTCGNIKQRNGKV
jgi:hypothetical protein